MWLQSSTTAVSILQIGISHNTKGANKDGFTETVTNNITNLWLSQASRVAAKYSHNHIINTRIICATMKLI